MIALVFITASLLGFWFGAVFGYVRAHDHLTRETRTMSEPDPKILTFTRFTTLSRGHR